MSSSTLESENEILRSKILALEAQLATAEMAPQMERASSILSDGTAVPITRSELEAMRAIFNQLDTNNSGTIDADELRSLHARLGDPISEEEAKEALAFMSSSGEVGFEEFMRWWNHDKALDGVETDRQARYRSKFQFVRSQVGTPDLASVETRHTGREFEYRVRFYIRPSESASAGSATGPAGQQLVRQRSVSGSEPPAARDLVEMSPWHDIPLFNDDGTLNMVVEIPKWTRAKYEIATGEDFNPIKQDVKNGRLRSYVYGDMFGNYGAFPQTWEDPAHVTEGLGTHGDNDPLDVVEVGAKQWKTGSIVRVKVLGVFALIDGGETDWKVLTICANDPMAEVLNDVEDLRAHMPGLLESVCRWFKTYKTAEGSGINVIGFDERPRDRAYAMSVVHETHEFWKALIRSERRTV